MVDLHGITTQAQRPPHKQHNKTKRTTTSKRTTTTTTTQRLRLDAYLLMVKVGCVVIQ
jgi:hypothetical protein